MKILVVDGEQRWRSFLDKALSFKGHQVFSTGDGREALRRYWNDEFDMIFVDWSSSTLDGVTLCSEFRAQDRKSGTDSYIIVLLGENMKQDVIEGLEAGADDFISKPLENSVLEARLVLAEKALKARRNRLGEATMVLVEEHVELSRLMSLMEVVSGNLGSRDIPVEVLNWCRSAALTLDVKMHHGKEALYIERFVQNMDGERKDLDFYSLDKVLSEHERLEKLLGRVQKEIVNYSKDGSTDGLKDAVNKYVQFLRAHMAREDGVFFPYASRHMSENDDAELLRMYGDLEKGLGRERLNEMREKLDSVWESLNLEVRGE